MFSDQLIISAGAATHFDHSYLPSWPSQAAAQDWELDEEDMLVIEATYEGAKAQPTTDVFVWERGGAW